MRVSPGTAFSPLRGNPRSDLDSAAKIARANDSQLVLSVVQIRETGHALDPSPGRMGDNKADRE
jgi:hypothetical protein